MGAPTPIAKRSGLLLICYLAFVSLGLPDTLIGVAWPSVRQAFQLQQGDLSWIFIGGGCTYFLSSFLAGRLLKVWNVGIVLGVSSGLVALSALNYATAHLWMLFALGSLLHGLGSGAIDSGLNHYAASHFSAKHMNWLHACYSIGAMLGPIVMTAAITRAHSWRLGYAIVAAALFSLAAIFLITNRQWQDDSGNSKTGEPVSDDISMGFALSQKKVWLHIALFFVYTGIEVAIGQWSYSVLTESRGIRPSIAGTWVTIYWASILAGRIGFGFVVDRIGIDALVRYSTMAALAGTALFAWNPGPAASPLALSLCGFGLAVIFPSLMTRTHQRFGAAITRHAVGFQVGAAMLGAAFLPSGAGLIAQRAGLQFVPAGILVATVILFALHELVLSRDRAKAIT